jgi:3-oxoacyl-[acyl-carrier protein] reductase
MIENGYGRIVNVISDAGRVGDVTLEVYSAAKAGAAGFTRAIARTLGKHGITANCVSLAVIRTPTLEKKLSDPDVFKKMMANYIIRRPGEPEDAANMILMLGSDAAGWVTGQTYPVNGGFSLAL